MIEELAIVTRVDSNSVFVESELKSTCHGCEQSNTCASGQVAKALPKKQLKLSIPTKLSLNVGDKVVIALPQGNLLSAAAQTYLMPLAGVILFAGLATQVANELTTILASGLGGYLGYRIARFNQLRRQDNQKDWLQPQVLRKACESIDVRLVE